MAAHYYFNIELLPIRPEYGFVGIDGYFALFEKFSEIRKSKENRKKYSIEVFPLAGDFYLDFDTVHPDRVGKTVYGKLIKFDQVGSVKSRSTKEVQFEGSDDSSSKMYFFDYLFDCTSHIMAVSDNQQKLPAAGKMQDFIVYILEVLAKQMYPNHVLKVICLKSSDALEDVFNNAGGYNNIQVSVTFSNPDKALNALIVETEKELRDKGILEVVHQEKSEDGGMTEPSKLCRALLEMAKKFGDARINYMRKVGNDLKRKVFKMSDYPVTKDIRKGNSTDEQYRSKVIDSIRAADRDSTRT